MDTFALTKWYLDCVDANGRVAIAYWTEVAWRRLAVRWHSLAVYTPGADPIERSSTTAVAPPNNDAGTITWHAGHLRARVTCQSRVPAVSLRLLDADDGIVDWRCDAPRGDMCVECEDLEPLHGTGYAECLSLTVPPWRLPIETLRWGRWHSSSSERSLVWIDWRGPHPLTAIAVDGRMQRIGIVGDERIESADAALMLTNRRTLYSRSLSDTLGVLRPALAPVLPQSWLALEDTKWRSLGSLRTAGRPDESGWVIHETVRWPS